MNCFKSQIYFEMSSIQLILRSSIAKFVIYLLIFSTLISCSQKEPRIGFLLPNLVLKRYLKEKELFSQKIKELGGSVTIFSADDKDNLQIQQAEDLIAQGTDVLVVCSVNSNTAAAIVRIAHTKNIPVIAYDRLIRNCNLDYFLSFDNDKVGTLMAEYVTKIKPSGKYILLGGDRGDQNAVWVKAGQLKTLEPMINSGKISIVYNIYIEDWSGENAKHEIKNYLDLSLDKPDVILSSNDGMATSVIELLKEYNLNKDILITGQDADIEACRNIVRGDQIMTVYKPLKDLAYKAAELAIKIAKGEKITDASVKVNNGKVDVTSLLLKPTIVDKDNIKSTVVADGFFLENEINK
jgi:D-xylose transport system substrate-binding protein